MATKTFVSFLLENQLFGLDIRLVREINKYLDLTPVPNAMEYIRGLINLRGQIVTVIDLKRRLGFDKSETKMTAAHNIILKTDAELASSKMMNEEHEELYTATDKVSLCVDTIGDIITVDQKDIELPPANINIGSIDGKYLSGVIKLDNTLMAVLCVPKVLSQKSD